MSTNPTRKTLVASTKKAVAKKAAGKRTRSADTGRYVDKADQPKVQGHDGVAPVEVVDKGGTTP